MPSIRDEFDRILDLRWSLARDQCASQPICALRVGPNRGKTPKSCSFKNEGIPEGQKPRLLANLFFMARAYTRLQPRFLFADYSSGFNYDVSIFVPRNSALRDVGPDQETLNQTDQYTEFLSYLRRLKSEGTSEERKFSKYGLDKPNRALYTELDDWFWRLLKEDGGPEEIVRIFRSWLGSGTRSFSD